MTHMKRAFTVFLVLALVGGLLFALLHTFLGELRGEPLILFWIFVSAIAAASLYIRDRQ